MKNIFRLFILSTLASCANSVPKSEKDSLAALPPDTVKTTAEKIDLPPPYATPSVTNMSDAIGWKDNLTPTAPEGFTVTKYAGNLENPRWIYVLPNGDVLVAEAKHDASKLMNIANAVTGKNKSQRKSEYANRISLFRDTNKDGLPDVQTVFLSGLNFPFGMLLLNNYFYVANTDGLWRYAYTTGETSIKTQGEKILDLPGEGRHWTRNIIANSAGTKIYIAVGSSTNVAENGIDKEVHRANILEINPDGSELRVYASGLRNPVGMDWAPGTNTLWTAVNERDELGDKLVPDYLTSVKDGGFYGWPYSYFGDHIDPRIKNEDQRPDLVKNAIVPDMPLGNHTASLGLAFYDQDAFPQKYHNGAFIGQHGSWNSSTLVGYKVAFIPFKNGKPSGDIEDFLTGFIADASKNQVYGRPVGVAVLPDGSLLVADDAGNTIWRVSYKK
jgi:glucose/arabinose dehydrogenase